MCLITNSTTNSVVHSRSVIQYYVIRIKQNIIYSDKSKYGFIVENYEDDELAKKKQILREIK